MVKKGLIESKLSIKPIHKIVIFMDNSEVVFLHFFVNEKTKVIFFAIRHDGTHFLDWLLNEYSQKDSPL